MRKSRFTLLLAVLFGFALVSGTVASAQEEEGEDNFSIDVATLVPLVDAEGNQVGLAAVGTAEDNEGGIIAMVQGLTEGQHGVHLHAVGNCDPAGEKTFEQAGGHFNPGDMPHPNHAGDLGNLTASANGDAIFLAGLGVMTLDAGEFGIVDADGTALVIHETVDDLATDPAGNSGARIACAVLFAPSA